MTNIELGEIQQIAIKAREHGQNNFAETVGKLLAEMAAREANYKAAADEVLSDMKDMAQLVLKTSVENMALKIELTLIKGLVGK